VQKTEIVVLGRAELVEMAVREVESDGEARHDIEMERVATLWQLIHDVRELVCLG
jgi:hypothetical protein